MFIKAVSAIFYERLLYNPTPVASFTQEVKPRLTKRPLKTNRELTSLVKEATGGIVDWSKSFYHSNFLVNITV